MEVLAPLKAALAQGRNAVLVAPPGAGKTTAVAPALLDEPWVQGQRILLLSPRRLAARAAAERMAFLSGQPLGGLIGFRTRLEQRVSKDTRIEVITEGIFVRRIAADPELQGVAAVLFDEVHERSLDSDVGLALALEAQAVLRPDLRLLAMSATLDGARYAALMGDAPVVESQGRMFPVAFHYRPRAPQTRLDEAMAAAIHAALAQEAGSIVAFLPGAADIERTAERVKLPDDVDLHRLYGARDGQSQRAAIAPAPAGRRKLVLATSIAETSITIDGVRVVIDSGLARRARYDRATGLTRLVTERASLAAVRQRAGRAGRTAPGLCIRLWEESATAGLTPFDPPEILEADLSGLLLDLAVWGVQDPAQLAWIDPPPAAAVAEARDRLQWLEALDDMGRVTDHGRAMARLPLAPRLAHMLIRAQEAQMGMTAAHMAVLLSEPTLGGRAPDLEERLRLWARARDPRSQAARQMAARWAKYIGAEGDADAADAGAVLALAFPDRVAKRRDSAHQSYVMANGRAVTLDAATALAQSVWIVVADAMGAAEGARMLAGAALTDTQVQEIIARHGRRQNHVAYEAATGRVLAEEREYLGAILIARRPIAEPDAALVQQALLEAFVAKGIESWPWGEAAQSLRARAQFLRAQGEADVPDLSDAHLLATVDHWLAPHLTGVRKVGAIDAALLHQALDTLVDWPTRQRIDTLAPAQFETALGTHHAIDYAAEAGPTVAIRVQALFGMAHHPMVAQGRIPLTLALLSPAGRPIQTTRDLPGFWAGSWKAVQAEMKGRYPKHPWPDKPQEARPTTRTKAADARRGLP